jgi:hypothetical protein
MEFLLENLEVLFTLRDKPQAPLYRLPGVVPLQIHKALLLYRNLYMGSIHGEGMWLHYTPGLYLYR